MNPSEGSLGSTEDSLSSFDFSTPLVPKLLRNDAWRHLTASFFEAASADNQEHTQLEGGITAYVLGSSVIGSLWCNAQRQERSQCLVLSSGLDQYVVQLCLAGSLNVVCGTRTVDARIGDIMVLDLAKATSIYSPRGRNTIWMIVPRDTLEQKCGRRNLHGALIRASDPLTGLLSKLLLSLCQQGSFRHDVDTRSVERAVMSLLAGTIIYNRADPILPDPELSVLLRRRILVHVDEHLTIPQMGLVYLMERFNVSRAHLYRAFSEDGGVAAMIRDRRLDAAYKELVGQGRHCPESITQTAHKYFFSSSNQFLRAFRSRFSYSPSEARKLGMGVQVQNSKNGILNHLTGVAESLSAPHS